MPDSVASLLALEVARIGLDHWKVGAGSMASVFLDGVLSVMNNKAKERDFIQSYPCAITDVRWSKVIARTCTFATYSAARVDARGPMLFPYLKIDACACPIPKHKAMDGFVAHASDPVWDNLRPPFDWLCACSLGLALDGFDPHVAASAAAPRIPKAFLSSVTPWLGRSPERSFGVL